MNHSSIGSTFHICKLAGSVGALQEMGGSLVMALKESSIMGVFIKVGRLREAALFDEASCEREQNRESLLPRASTTKWVWCSRILEMLCLWETRV